MRKADRRTARSEGVDGWGTGVDHRGHAEAEIKSLQQLLAGASDVRNTALSYMLDAQTELLRRGDFGDGRRNAGLARGIADLLHQLVTSAEAVPGSAYEQLVAAREMLEALRQQGVLGQDFVAAPGGPTRAADAADADAVFRDVVRVPAAAEAAGGGAASAEEELRVTDAQLLEFVVGKVAAGATHFKANKLHQVLAALVKEHLMPAAVAATRKALDPTMRGHIEVAAFVEWWPRSKFASAACENGWMKQLNAEALRTKLTAEALQRQVEAKAAAEEAAAEEEAAAAGRRKSLAQQPKRSQALLSRLRNAEGLVQKAHADALFEALRVVEDMQEFDAEFIELMHRQLLNSSPLMRPDRLGTFPVVIAHKQRVLELMAQLDAAQASAAFLLLFPAARSAALCPTRPRVLAADRPSPHRRPPSERRARTAHGASSTTRSGRRRCTTGCTSARRRSRRRGCAPASRRRATGWATRRRRRSGSCSARKSSAGSTTRWRVTSSGSTTPTKRG
jgi:hypothetical protein